MYTSWLVVISITQALIGLATGYGHTSESCAQQFLDTLQDLFLYQHINLPTRYRHGQVSNTLDLVITNEEHMIDHFHSHLGLFLVTTLASSSPTLAILVCPTTIPLDAISTVLTDKLKSLMSNIDWNDAIGNLSFGCVGLFL